MKMNTLPISEYAYLRTSAAKEIKKINHRDLLLRIITSKKTWSIRGLTAFFADVIINRHLSMVREQEIFIRGLSSKISQVRVKARHGELDDEWSMEDVLTLIKHSKGVIKRLISKVNSLAKKNGSPFNENSIEKLSSALYSLFEALDDLYVEVLEMEASLAPIGKLSITSNEDLNKFIETISSGQ